MEIFENMARLGCCVQYDLARAVMGFLIINYFSLLYTHETVFPLVSLNEYDEQGIIYPVLQ